jgi:hypothetical protein
MVLVFQCKMAGKAKKVSKYFPTAFHLDNKKRSMALDDAFLVFQGFIDDWKINKDYPIIGMFLQHRGYKEVAEAANKDRSLMWKRERSLKLDQYFATKEIIKYIGEGSDA